MTLFSKMFGWLGGNANTNKPGIQQATPSTSVHEDSPTVGVDGSLQISTVWACVSLLAETIASLPVSVHRVNSKNERESLRGTRLYSIFHTSPNARQTSQEFWETMLLNYFLRRNAFARVVRDKTNGEVVAMWPLSAEQMQVELVADGTILYYYSYNNETLVYTDKDILHIYGMGNGLVGLSQLDYMRSSVSIAVKAQNHTSKTYRKDARRPGVLMTDALLTAEQRARVKENFGDIATGSGSELHVLEAQFKFEPLGMSPADIQLLESRKFSVEDLARWFGVPSVLINDTSTTTALGSSIGQIIEGFYKLKLRPQLTRIEQAISKRVLSSRQRAEGVAVEFNLDALLRASLKDRMEVYSKAVQNGLKTRNECRAKENDPPLPGGDLLTAQSNLWPVEKLGEQNAAKGEPPAETVRQ